ncbi:phosphoribosylanthranilate isomerase [Roseivirga sp.]|uniref:phosphoribosylanthranilate isomerase n=1 Tax=Roseivirga sp. TaxID=1964215 RepID=UPI003B8D219D
MALKTFVVVSGINNLSDARYCAGMEVNELGFNIEAENSNYTDPDKFKEMTDWLSGVEFVGEVLSETTDLVETTKSYNLNGIQISHLSQVKAAIALNLKVIFNADSIEIAQAAWDASGKSLSYVILNGTISTPDLIDVSFPFVLAEGFNADTVLAMLETNKPKGILLKGGDEIRPGYKDFDELADILEVLEIDDLAE